MSKIAVVFWSGTGNTEAMANAVADGARNAGAEVDLIAASDFNSGRIGDYDAFAFGCPAMGDEELEEMEFLPMYDEVEPELDGKKTLLFGSYEWNTGEWMDLWKDRATAAGVNLTSTVIAYDYPDADAIAECEKAGAQLA